MLLPIYVLLDLETTGATPTHDRITEIGLIRYENGIEVGRWDTLINPEVSISPFIQRLTGITHDMLENAPTFFQALAPCHKVHTHLQAGSESPVLGV